jgi:3-dehydroquinate synthetase
VRFVQAPTTLLAMVDASVGGKVGVDLPQGKNLVGAFKQPEAVLMDTHVLATLPEREWRCGLAEVIKHGLLSGDESLLNSARMLQKPGSRAEAAHDLFVQRAVQVKVDIVQQDPFEANIRAYLNLGHTFAHAVEQVSGYTWAHGEAVGVGLLAAARLSLAQGLCEPTLVEQVRAVLLDVGLPVQLDGFDPELLYAAMGTDKKRQAGRLRFVLLRGVGQPVIADDVPKKRVLDVLDSLRGR